MSLLVSPQIKTRTRVATKKQRHKGKVTSRTLFVPFVPFCGDAYLLIRRVLPPPLIDRLIWRATSSAFANTRRKFSPRILRMSCSL